MGAGDDDNGEYQDQRVNGWSVCGGNTGDMQLACGWRVGAALVVGGWSVLTCGCVLVCGLPCAWYAGGKWGGMELSRRCSQGVCVGIGWFAPDSGYVMIYLICPLLCLPSRH